MNFDSAGVEEPGPSNAASSIVIHPSPAQTTGESSADDTSKVNCDCLGFTSFTVPNQPVDVSESKKTYSYHNKEKNSDDSKVYSRRIQSNWCAKFSQITVCTSTFRIYFVICRNAKHDKLLLTKQMSTFIDEGFCN